MNLNYKPNERELVKLANFFKKESKRLMAEGKLGEDQQKVEEAVDRFIKHLEGHANNRAFMQEQRQALMKLVKDDAACPKCHKKDMLKLHGTEKNEKGWKSNRYRCRRCNIAFTWNRPNNPWDLIQYTGQMLQDFEGKLADTLSETEREHTTAAMQSARANLEKIRPVIEAHDKEYNDFQERELEMEKLVHEFKNTLMIEKIKMDTWENRKK